MRSAKQEVQYTMTMPPVMSLFHWNLLRDRLTFSAPFQFEHIVIWFTEDVSERKWLLRDRLTSSAPFQFVHIVI